MIRLPWNLVERSLRSPRAVIAAAALLTAAALPGLFRLELRTDGHALVPPDDPAVRYDERVRERFGLRDPLVVLVENDGPRGVLNPRTLQKVQQLSDLFARFPEIGPRHVASLATEHRNRVYPGTLKFRPFLDPPPDTPQLLDLLETDLKAAGILDGTLISADRQAATILLGVPPVDLKRPYNRAALYERVEQAVLPYRKDGDRIAVVGAPAAESLLGTHILEDLRLLLPLSIAAIGLIVWLGTRRLAAVAVAYLKVVLCLVWTFGLMGWVGSPVYLTTAVLPVILVTVGLAYEIHLLWHYQRALEQKESPGADPLAETFAELARPVAWSSATTAFGFFSFLTSTLAPVRAFGVFAGLGVLFCLLGSLTLVPAVLRLLPPAALRHPRSRAGDGGEGRRGKLLSALTPLLARPRLALAGLGLLTVVLGLGTARLSIQDSWIDGFARQSPFRQATDRVNARLFGTHLLLAHVRFDPPPRRKSATDEDELMMDDEKRGALLDPALLQSLDRFEREVRALPGVGGVLGATSQMAAVHALWMAREEARILPQEPQRIAQLLEMYDLGRGADLRREVIADDYDQVIVTVFLKDANFRDTARLMTGIRRAAKRHLTPYHGHLGFAGDVAVSQAMIPAIVRTQVGSVLGSLLGCLGALLVLHRSVRLGIVAVVPTVLATLWVFGLMGWLGIPLGVATSMFCAITIGIGDDYAIHFLHRWRAAREAGSAQPVLDAVGDAGPAIFNDTLAIAVGFGLLAVSQVPANARLGILVAVSLISGCLLTLLGLGALLETRLGQRVLGAPGQRQRPASPLAPAAPGAGVPG